MTTDQITLFAILTALFALLFATVLTLGVVPLLYSIFFRVRFKGFSW